MGTAQQPRPAPTSDPLTDDALYGLTDPDRDVRQAAALALGGSGDPRAAAELVVRMLGEPDFFVRETLTWAVARVADAATPLLLQALDGTGGDTRVRVLHALSKIADPATTDAVLPLAADDDPAVAAKARWTLTRIGDPRAVPAVAAHLGTDVDRNGVTADLASFGRAAVPALVTALAADDPRVRRHAAEVLAFIGAPGAQDAAEALGAAVGDGDDQVRLSAAMALLDLRTPAAHAVLAGSPDPRVRAIAARAAPPA